MRTARPVTLPVRRVRADPSAPVPRGAWFTGVPAVAQVLDEMGTLLELRGENPFRCRAYHTAAQALKALPGDVAELLASGGLTDVPGIGPTMLDKITRLVTTGALPEHDELRRETPPGLMDLLRVPGLGTSKIKALRGRVRD